MARVSFAFLEQVAATHGYPRSTTVDNGPAFVSNALDPWAHAHEVQLHFSRPGKPVDNAFIESFDGRLRDECLNTNWFDGLEQAREVIGAWLVDYNQHRPHSSLAASGLNKGGTSADVSAIYQDCTVQPMC